MVAVDVVDPDTVLHDRRPLIDLRSPAEFAQGAFPGATNLPLLSDNERAAVGQRYKAEGQAAAIELGERLVAGEDRERRLQCWLDFAAVHPDAALYCWRGGLRSTIVQTWMARAGRRLPRVSGGYKALRKVCIHSIDHTAARQPLLVLGGRTGAGKTALLREFKAAVDLEALANHRGSAFGGALDQQPTPIDFENHLAIELLQRTQLPRLLLEDESRTIGRLALPETLHRAMQQAPLVVLEVPRAERARHIAAEYVHAPLVAGVSPLSLAGQLLAATDRIRRRLGGERHAKIRALIAAAFQAQEPAAHERWIGQLLEWYYDPMYDHQLEAKQSRICARGDRRSLRRDLAHLLESTANPAIRRR
jgi:tRNA 2-selenouridine synthase